MRDGRLKINIYKVEDKDRLLLKITKSKLIGESKKYRSM